MRKQFPFLAALISIGCVGSLGDPGGEDDDVITGTDPGDPRLDARVWRLSPEQYNGEVQRFFPGAPTVNLPEGASEYGLANIANTARIDLGNASQFTEAARTIGSWVAAQGAAAARCDTFGTDECVQTFLDWFPEQAFRRPPTEDERAALQAVYDDTRPTYGEEWAFAAMVRAALLSPEFLYRYEVGGVGEGVVELTDYEIASQLSFAITNEGPDAELLADAKSGLLRDPAIREDNVRRLMDRSAGMWQRFFWQWLKMSTLESQGNETELDPQLVAALEAEYNEYVNQVVVLGRGSLEDLLSTSHTWATPEVAAYYGATHPGTGVAQFELDPAQRGGLLTLGAWLVAHGKKGRDNVVRRGMSVFRDGMCNDIVPLPIDLVAAQEELVGADATIKEIAAARSTNGTCGACHSTSDPVGLSFETFAGNGTWQTVYADGKPVEADVTLDGTFYATAPELSLGLARDQEFQECLVRRFGHFTLGAEFGAPMQVRASKEAYDAFIQSAGSFEELLVAIVRDRSFIERKK